MQAYYTLTFHSLLYHVKKNRYKDKKVNISVIEVQFHHCVTKQLLYNH